jgi:predicted transcriptional regulator
MFQAMGHKRSRHQILSQILTTCQERGASKTKVVYNCNLNFATVKPHLDLLMANGLLEATGGHNIFYMTTEKGALVLDHMKEIARLMPISGNASLQDEA